MTTPPKPAGFLEVASRDQFELLAFDHHAEIEFLDGWAVLTVRAGSFCTRIEQVSA